MKNKTTACNKGTGLTPQQAFDKYVIKNENGCWLWSGTIGDKGFPRFKAQGKNISAHRFSYINNKGPIGTKLVLKHSCLNKSCSNPEHLYLLKVGDWNRSIDSLKASYEDGVIRNETGCWNWSKRKDKDGYGRAWFNNKYSMAHRISWIINNNEIPEGMFVLHKCDFPPCSRIDHLFLGNPKDNSADMTNKNRQHRKLSDEKIKKIILLVKEGAEQKAVAKLFKIHYTTVNQIVHYKGCYEKYKDLEF